MQGFCKTCIAALFLIPLTVSAAAAEWKLSLIATGFEYSCACVMSSAVTTLSE